MKKFYVLTLLMIYVSYTCSQNWQALGNGTDNTVRAVTSYGNSLIAGGFFQTAGNVSVNSIAEWNGSSWLPLGRGIDTVPFGNVLALTEASIPPPYSYLYAGGSFSKAGGDTAAKNIARWDGGNWEPLAYGLDGNVNAIVEFPPDLIIAGGGFTSARFGVQTRYIAQWNGTSWDSLNGGGVDGPVITLAEQFGSIIAGGAFIHAGGSNVNYIARWEGSVWTPLGTGMDNLVQSVVIYNGEIIAGGLFTHSGGVLTNRVARWNGGSWEALGNGLPTGGVTALTICNNQLIAATSGGSSYFIYVWNGSTWLPLGGGTNGNVYALYADTTLYAGGQFTTAGGVTANHIAKWAGPIGIKSVSSEIPKKYSIAQNYPNPFNPVTKIKFELPESSFTTLKVFDALGKEVATLVNEKLSAGSYEETWDASELSSGIYFYRIESNNFFETKKMILLK